MSKGRKATQREEAGPRLDLERYFPFMITALTNKLSRSASATYQSHFGVNVTEWRVMSLLAIEPGISATRICQVIGYDKGPISRLLKAMEDKGLVTIRQDPAHARKHAIALTEAGLAKHDDVIRLALDRETRLLACLAADERDILLGLLRRVHDNLGAVIND